jgi:geranylgeranyl diphosphate synthase, type I
MTASPRLRSDDELVGRVDGTLAEYLAQRRAELDAIHDQVAEAASALREFVLTGGKRVRPTFAWWGWRGAGGEPDSEPVLRAISALELIQASALLHDDVLDSSRTRRGRPTVHVAFAGRHRTANWRGDPDHFGESAAILLGDLALAWADDLFHDAGLDWAGYQRARPVWRAMRSEMLGGQYLDVVAQASADTSADTAMRVNRFKTAAYTVRRPLQLGAALAGAPGEVLEAYQRFGTDLGIAFQLRDDQLGLFGDPAVTGKPAGDDVREGKRTVLMAWAMEAATARGDTAALRTLTDALGDPDLDDTRVDQVRSIVLELGAAERIERRIAELTDTALAALRTVELAEPAASRLLELAHAVTRRQS